MRKIIITWGAALRRFVVLAPVFAAVFGLEGLAAQTPTALSLLQRVDNNRIYGTIQYDGDMIIEYNNRRNVKTMKAWARENSDSFIEFLNPEDSGTRYLKRGGRLFVYSPDTEEVTPISGHMLQESMMGSDLSYEDTIENEKLSVRYDPIMAGSEVWNGRDAWVLDLTAKRKTESYQKQKLWIDKVNGDLLHYELFALSGAKLKEYTLIRAENFGNRRFPVESEMRDMLRRGSRTVFTMRNVVLDQPIPERIFNVRNLER